MLCALINCRGNRLFPIRERGVNQHSQELQRQEAEVCVFGVPLEYAIQLVLFVVLVPCTFKALINRNNQPSRTIPNVW